MCADINFLNLYLIFFPNFPCIGAKSARLLVCSFWFSVWGDELVSLFIYGCCACPFCVFGVWIMVFLFQMISYVVGLVLFFLLICDLQTVLWCPFDLSSIIITRARLWMIYFIYIHIIACDCVGDKKCLNAELWHACAGPLVSLPPLGSRVVYFPQGHSEQVSNTTTTTSSIWKLDLVHFFFFFSWIFGDAAIPMKVHKVI